MCAAFVKVILYSVKQVASTRNYPFYGDNEPLEIL